MSRPTGNSRYCEDGCKQLHGNIKHAVNKAAVKIHIDADTFINLAFLITALLHAKGFMEAWKNTARKEIVEQKIIAKSANAQLK